MPRETRSQEKDLLSRPPLSPSLWVATARPAPETPPLTEEVDCDALCGGWLHGIHNAKALQAAEKRVAHWQGHGAPITLLDRAETERLSGTKGCIGTLSDVRGGSLNPLCYARGIADAAIRAGVRLHGASPATGIEKDAMHWRVSTPQGSVRAEQVLLCTNAYGDDLWPGLKQSVVPIFSYQIATRPNARVSYWVAGRGSGPAPLRSIGRFQ